MEGRGGKGPALQSELPLGRGGHGVVISREPWQSVACFNPQWQAPSPSLPSSTPTSRPEEAWLGTSALTTSLQAPLTGLQTSLPLPVLSSASVQEGPPQTPFHTLIPTVRQLLCGRLLSSVRFVILCLGVDTRYISS